MIQRIQTVYLLGAIGMLVLASFVGDLFYYVTDEAIFNFNGFGISKLSLDNKELITYATMPFCVITLVLAAFALFVMLSYKKLNKQFAYSKILWGLYLLTIIGVVVWNYLIAPNQLSGKVIQNNYGSAFYFLVIGLPLVHLAFMGIGKDKKTIDSLNRLR
ncbi:MAG: DUF4293 domain-containing protein [Crocinitomicaceae bacterium]|nr:DUF4293 domain-containing protein [Crocinitomicaceae bacterium]